MRLEFCVMYRNDVPEAALGPTGDPEDLSLNGLRHKSLTDMMVSARCDEPQFTHLVPDARDRRRVLSWFFESVTIPASERHGEIYTSNIIDAAALWIRPGQQATFKRMVLSGLRSYPIGLDLSIASR